jgi:hypothetical protein
MQRRGYRQTLWNLNEIGRKTVTKSVSIFNEHRIEIPML